MKNLLLTIRHMFRKLVSRTKDHDESTSPRLDLSAWCIEVSESLGLQPPDLVPILRREKHHEQWRAWAEEVYRTANNGESAEKIWDGELREWIAIAVAKSKEWETSAKTLANFAVALEPDTSEDPKMSGSTLD